MPEHSKQDARLQSTWQWIVARCVADGRCDCGNAAMLEACPKDTGRPPAAPEHSASLENGQLLKAARAAERCLVIEGEDDETHPYWDELCRLRAAIAAAEASPSPVTPGVIDALCFACEHADYSSEDGDPFPDWYETVCTFIDAHGGRADKQGGDAP